MPARWRLTAAVSLAATGCGSVTAVVDEGDSTEGSGPAAVTILAEINPEAYCATVGLVEVRVRARRVGCDPDGTGPCTISSDPPQTPGDRFSCPATQPSALLGVEVDEPGVYIVEVVSRFVSEPDELDCYWAEDDEFRLAVSTAAIDDRAQVTVLATDEPCPGYEDDA